MLRGGNARAKTSSSEDTMLAVFMVTHDTSDLRPGNSEGVGQRAGCQQAGGSRVGGNR